MKTVLEALSNCGEILGLRNVLNDDIQAQLLLALLSEAKAVTIDRRRVILDLELVIGPQTVLQT